MEKMGQRNIDEEILKGFLTRCPGKSDNFYKCELCKCEISGVDQAHSHINGSKHIKKRTSENLFDSDSKFVNQCDISKVSLNCVNQYQVHLKDKSSKKMCLSDKYKDDNSIITIEVNQPIPQLFDD